jgi:hypothetical protein
MLDKINIETAGQLRIKSLYHYQPFRNDQDKKRLADILANKTIYCSNPADFNDPWDCRTYYDTSCLANAQRYAEHVQYFVRIDRKVNQL